MGVGATLLMQLVSSFMRSNWKYPSGAVLGRGLIAVLYGIIFIGVMYGVMVKVLLVVFP